MLSRVTVFENGDTSYSCGRGRVKTEVFKYDDVMLDSKTVPFLKSITELLCSVYYTLG